MNVHIGAVSHFARVQVEDTLKQVYYDTEIGLSMGDTAELLAQKYAITREMSDQYAVCTQQRWEKGTYTHTSTANSMTYINPLVHPFRPALAPFSAALPHCLKQRALHCVYSHCTARAEGRLEAELAPVSFVAADGSRVELAADEHPRPDTNLKTIARLPPVFRPTGLVTAANASVRTFAPPHCTCS